MRRLALLMALGLIGCAPRPDPQPAAPVTPLRDPGVMISSVVQFDPARFSGTWYVAQSGTPGCGGARQVWTRTDRGWNVAGADCAGPRVGTVAEHVVLTGPGGRFMPQRSFAGHKIWVLWADAGYNIAVLGTPSGQFGTILSRQIPPKPDLLFAAQRVLDFNGYDMRRMVH